MDAGKLKIVLEKHKLWLEGKKGGERAYLREADLQWAYLQGADLQGADLRGANLQEAIFADGWKIVKA